MNYEGINADIKEQKEKEKQMSYLQEYCSKK